jgi:hypothetical protein
MSSCLADIEKVRPFNYVYLGIKAVKPIIEIDDRNRQNLLQQIFRKKEGA